MAEKTNLLFPLNTLIQELKLCGWNDEADKLIEVRELVWSEDLAFTPTPSNAIAVPVTTWDSTGTKEVATW